MVTHLILSSLLLFSIQSETVNPLQQACSCNQLLTQFDCLLKVDCQWTSISNTAGLCSAGSPSVPQPVSLLCSPLDLKSCPKQIGCAYYNSKCIHFSGCSSYVKQTTADCQAISKLCISDGTTCIFAKTCQEYTSQTDCLLNPSSSGQGSCQWENGLCRDYICSEAPIALTTDSECDTWMKGCKTTGKGCIASLGICSFYVGDSQTCAGLIGTDGHCEGVAGGTNCRVRTCQGAPSTMKTDQECSQYRQGCVTTGKGCAETLELCGTYNGDAITCLGYLGIDGWCEGESGGTNCKGRQCSSAPIPYDTDAACNMYKPGCVTTGKSCAAVRQACSGYTGTVSTCEGYIGTDGYCKGVSNTEIKPCAAKLCTEAPTSIKTDEGCQAFQVRCLTNGKGCVSELGKCESFRGTISSCESYIGSDGRCKGVSSTVQACVKKQCGEAQTTLATHQECKAYQFGCLTNGNGCVQQGECQFTVKQISCLATDRCSWNGVCTDGLNCSSFVTVSMCVDNYVNGQNGFRIPCVWEKDACRNAKCSDASASLVRDAQCQQFMVGCKAKGQGCIESSEPCSAYQGTQQACYEYGCWNILEASNTSSCIERKCNHNITSLTDDECNKFKVGCRNKGAGCLEPSEPCSSYQGTQSICDKYVGNGQRCWNIRNDQVAACIPKLCTHNTYSTTDAECDTFLKGCLTTGAGCVSKSDPCSVYTGSQVECSYFKGNGLPCWNLSPVRGPCLTRVCAHKAGVSTDAECSEFLAGCVSAGVGCVLAAAPCSSYVGNFSSCQSFKGDGKPCYNKDPCSDRSCSDVTTDCTSYHSSCRVLGNRCVSVGSCNSYTERSLELCKEIANTMSNKCWFLSGGSTCVDRQCSYATGVSSQADCTNFLAGCKFDGATCVASQASCSSYSAFGGTNQIKLANCSTLTNNANQPCFYSVGASCEERTCSNTPTPTSQSSCDLHKQGCFWNGLSCITINPVCEMTPVSGTDTVKLALCSTLTDAAGKKCKHQAGQANCSTRACADVPSPLSSANCTDWLVTCRFNGSVCVDASTCSAYTLAGALLGQTNTQKRDFCNALTASDGTFCTYADNAATCSVRTCTNAPTTESGCLGWLSSCRWDGQSCLVSAACTAYTITQPDTSGRQAQCNSLTDTTNVRCMYQSGLQCSTRTCGNAATPTVDNDCKNYLANCMISWNSPTVCVDRSLACTLLRGTATQCRSMKGVNGTEICWNNLGASESIAEFCKAKACTDNTTSRTNSDCEQFMAGCKTTGLGCVASTFACNQQNGNATTCVKFKAGDGINYCKQGPTLNDSCTLKTCYDDGTSTTDAACQAFLAGCVTNGQGCIPSSEPCSSFKGTQQQCMNFVGNGKKCFNTSSANTSTPCQEKVCADDTTSITDTECSVIGNCLTRGVGCIDAAAPCTDYRGPRALCLLRKGLNGTQICWNEIGAVDTTPCVVKTCQMNTTAKTNEECTTFLKDCVTNGKGCLPKASICDNFQGTSNTECALFTASDGPCKLGLQGKCTPRICSEAPNSYATNEMCRSHHPTCYTNGYGCQSTPLLCKQLQEKNSCQKQTGCNWVFNCRTIENKCELYTNFGPSVCVNTPVSTGMKICAWVGENCRSMTCEWLPNILSSHESCQSYSTSCTTTGTGCITIGACKGYLTQATCYNARTTDLGGQCVWENQVCRSRKCTDAPFELKTNDACSNFLVGCVSNGERCLPIDYDCSFHSTQRFCLLDGLQRPCLWVSNKCINYSRCEDVQLSIHSDCQSYSNQCTTDGSKCVPLQQCSRYMSPQFCILGTDGQCGWMPPQGSSGPKCVPFTKCEDASASDRMSCMAYNPTCVSEGEKCITQAKCESYTTWTACDQGTDGVCFYDKDKRVCRLRECTDAVALYPEQVSKFATFSGCQGFDTKCTTSGAGCAALANCASYASDVSCQLGTDGECIFDKTCRLVACEDFAFTDAAQCGRRLATCTSDGKRCVLKEECSKYKTKDLCKGGGLDGVCAWDAAGSACKSLGKCSDADSDSAACLSKPEACIWRVNKDGSTKCSEQSCATKAVGGECRPVPSFQGKTYTVCVATQGGCVAGESTQLKSATCYVDTMGTHRWNTANSKCEACFEVVQGNNPGNVNTVVKSIEGSRMVALIVVVLILS